MAHQVKRTLCSDNFTHPIAQCGTQKTYKEYISLINNNENIQTITNGRMSQETEFFDWTPIESKIHHSTTSRESSKSQE